METVFVSQLKTLFDLVADTLPLYVPLRQGDHYFFARYDPAQGTKADFNELRPCSTAKEFLFPLREMAAVFPQPPDSDEEISPYAVFGLKSCDLRSLEILDRVFREDEFQDPGYVKRREAMLILSSDCVNPGGNCFCGLLNGQACPAEGFDLNLSQIEDGFLIQVGSDKGRLFIQEHEEKFAEVPHTALQQRDQNRRIAQKQIEDNAREYQPRMPIRELVLNHREAELFEEEAAGCVECQGCTRICPTCHCFYLFDEKRDHYYTKMKIWDSCVRMSFARVAGGENPRKKTADRARHRLLHKFVYFWDRYGINMCVGCGRCIEVCAGDIDLRDMIKRLSENGNQKPGSR